MIKLEIFPSFLDSCVFEIDRRRGIFTFFKNAKTLANKNQKKWEVNISKHSDFIKLIDLAKKVVTNKINDNRIILDGVSLICTISENQIHDTHEFRCPDTGTDELLLAKKFIELGTSLIADQEFINYIELLEGYFSDYLPIKHFAEKPYRLRIYGMLSIYEKNGLINEVAKVLSKEEVIIDMTNFVGMGTTLYECFEPLKRKTRVKFLVNENALQTLKEMNFEMDIILKTV
jgi:hypothetical protein